MDKEAQNYLLANNPKYVADQIKGIIGVMVGRMSPEAQYRAWPNIADKVKQLNTVEMANKKSPGGASIGVSLSLIKNILNGRDPVFINQVISELTKGL
jgi:hypothetical protein